MPAIKPKQAVPRTKSMASANQTVNVTAPVLTLTEAAAYLRVEEEVVLELVRQQGLPGRCLGKEWRFSQAALEVWLAAPNRPSDQQMSSIIGAWKDDPHLEEMLDQIYQQRGRPMAEPSR